MEIVKIEKFQFNGNDYEIRVLAIDGQFKVCAYLEISKPVTFTVLMRLLTSIFVNHKGNQLMTNLLRMLRLISKIDIWRNILRL